jgi:hypothetical protein
MPAHGMQPSGGAGGYLIADCGMRVAESENPKCAIPNSQFDEVAMTKSK